MIVKRKNQTTQVSAESVLRQIERMMGGSLNGEIKYSAVWAWVFVPERFLSEEMESTKKAMQDAQKQNPHALAYFLGHRNLPKNIPDSYSPWRREEAIIAWDLSRHAWGKHPKALVRLKTQHHQYGGTQDYSLLVSQASFQTS